MSTPLRFYDCSTAPSPRRARIFIAEKALEIDTIEVDLGNGEHLGEEFRRINPHCSVPVLTLDDGTALTENAGIAAFLEHYCPEPPLLGSDSKQIGLTAMWNARIELEGLLPVADAFRNRSKGLKDRAVVGPKNFAQIPALSERGFARAEEFFAMLDSTLAERPYIAGNNFSVADITALCVVDFAAWIKLTPHNDQTNLRRWHAEVSSRPSAQL